MKRQWNVACSMPHYLRGDYREGGGSLFPRSCVEKATGRKKGYSFQLDTRTSFHSENNALELISPGRWWFPQCWTLLWCWAGCWATLSGLCFCHEKLDQMIPEVHPTLCSLILWFSEICVSGHTHWCAAARWGRLWYKLNGAWLLHLHCLLKVKISRVGFVKYAGNNHRSVANRANDGTKVTIKLSVDIQALAF